MELEDLIESIDIVEFISQFVELEEKNGEFWGLSPFKDEKTPSFSVRKETKSFYDFSSGIGGNVFTFVKYLNKCSPREAIDILKQYVGCNDITLIPKQKLAATLVCKKFRPKVCHKKKSSVPDYPDNYMERYEKNDEKLAVWESEGISRASLNRFQIYYDSFSNRLVYPIRNLEGKIVNIGGRTLDPKWKDKGLRKYTYFSGWSEMNVVYGLFENLKHILKQREIIIFEGCKSVLIADTWGIKNCGALLTSHLNPQQLKLLVKLGVRVVFALDKDVRIRDDHNISKLRQYVNVDYLWDVRDLLSSKDSPVDKGERVFKKLYEQRLRYK